MNYSNTTQRLAPIVIGRHVDRCQNAAGLHGRCKLQAGHSGHCRWQHAKKGAK